MASKTVPGRVRPGRNSGSAPVGVHTLTSGGLQIDQEGVARAPLGEKLAPRSGSPAAVYTAWMSTPYRSAIRDPRVPVPEDANLLVPDATATAAAATPTTTTLVKTTTNGRRNLLFPISEHTTPKSPQTRAFPIRPTDGIRADHRPSRDPALGRFPLRRPRGSLAQTAPSARSGSRAAAPSIRRHGRPTSDD